MWFPLPLHSRVFSPKYIRELPIDGTLHTIETAVASNAMSLLTGSLDFGYRKEKSRRTGDLYEKNKGRLK